MDHVLAIADEAEAADGASPLDEAARMALADGAADGPRPRTTPSRSCTTATCRWWCAPTTRGRGLGTALLGGVEASYAGGLTAWSHGNHPAAARLAAAYGWDRVRDLWVMRRSASLPLPPLDVPDGRDDPVVARRRRRRGRGGQRGRLRAPPRAGRDGRRQPRAPDGRAVVRPGRPAGRRGRVGRARLPLDQAARRPDRRGLRRRRRPGRAGTRARQGAHPRRAAPPRRTGRRGGPALRRVRQRAGGRGLLTPRVRRTRTRTRTSSTAVPAVSEDA